MNFLALSRLFWVGVLLLVSLPVQARWATLQDAQSEIEFFNRDIQVNADGTYSEIIELQTKILKEDGRNSFATRPLVYNAVGTKLKVIQAKSIYEDHEVVLDSSKIEDKPLASSPNGFDEFHQVMLGYPHSSFQARHYLKYKVTVKIPPVSGFYSTDFIYGQGAYWKASRVRVVSELPLFVAINDPEHVLEVIEEPTDEKFILEINLKKPVFKEAVDESGYQVNPKALPWVTVSSERDWTVLSRKMAPRFEEIVRQPLPPAFKAIAAAAAKKSTLTDQINTVTSLLSEQVKYLGDWRSVEGRYTPRSLKDIAESHLGDCKDFSASTAAILKELGIQASFVAVLRGENAELIPNDLPHVGAFNHAMLRVKNGNRPIWLDPTNFSSFSQGLFPDISDRWALVLDSKSPARQRIPAIQPQEAQYLIEATVEPKGNDQTSTSGKFELKGGAALWLTGAELRASKESIDYAVIQSLGDIPKVTSWKVELPSLKSRIVGDMSFKYQFIEKGALLKTNLGPAVPLSVGTTLSSLLGITTDRVTDLYLGFPNLVQKKFIFKNLTPAAQAKMRCSIRSPWFDASRALNNTKAGLEVIDILTVKKSLIEGWELQTNDFVKTQNQLRECFDGVAIVFDQKHLSPKTSRSRL